MAVEVIVMEMVIVVGEMGVAVVINIKEVFLSWARL